MRPLQFLSNALRSRPPPTRRPSPQHTSFSGPRRQTTRQAYSTGPTNHNSGNTNIANPNPNANANTNTNAASTRVERIIARLPRPLQRHAARLRGAPLAHVTAFLILHELTAVAPLLGLFGLFHYWGGGGWAESRLAELCGGYVAEGARRFERYFRRKGWFGFGEGDGGDARQTEMEGGVEEGDEVMALGQRDPRYRVVVEVALAYAVTKALLPVRIAASLWATPWFAGVLMRLRRVVSRTR